MKLSLAPLSNKAFTWTARLPDLMLTGIFISTGSLVILRTNTLGILLAFGALALATRNSGFSVFSWEQQIHCDSTQAQLFLHDIQAVLLCSQERQQRLPRGTST